MKIPQKTSLSYFAPECELTDTFWEQFICTSPENGGNEDLVYENW